MPRQKQTIRHESLWQRDRFPSERLQDLPNEKFVAISYALRQNDTKIVIYGQQPFVKGAVM